MSAFTIAFQIPNLVRSLFADAAIQAALVPVFTEHLERGERREAFRLVSTLIFGFVLILGALTALFILVAPAVMQLFAPGFEGRIEDLTVALSRLLFPILLMLGVSGLVVGVLNSYDRFAVFAIAPFFWNVAIIAVLVGLAPAFPEEDKIYAYAIGVLVGTAVQLALVSWDLRNTPFRLQRVFAWTPDVRHVLMLMLPVTISLGLINFNLVINSFFGTLVSDRAPAAIDKAFRIYMLPQGMFSVAVATVVFPTLSRFAARGALDDLRATMANGMRQIVLLLTPAAAAILVLSEPMIRLVYERGEFGPSQTDLVATALFWFGFSLPFNGLFLLLTRTFFSLQRPWVPTAISAGTLSSPRSARWPSTVRSGSAGSSPRRRSRPRPASPPSASCSATLSADSSSAGWPRAGCGSVSPRPSWPASRTASGRCSTTPSGAASARRSSRWRRRWARDSSCTSGCSRRSGCPSSSRSAAW